MRDPLLLACCFIFYAIMSLFLKFYQILLLTVVSHFLFHFSNLAFCLLFSFITVSVALHTRYGTCSLTNTVLLLHVHLGLAHESRDPLVRFCRIQGTSIPTHGESGTLSCSCHILLRNYSFAADLYHFERCTDTWLMGAADSALLCKILNSSVGLVSEWPAFECWQLQGIFPSSSSSRPGESPLSFPLSRYQGFFLRR